MKVCGVSNMFRTQQMLACVSNKKQPTTLTFYDLKTLVDKILMINQIVIIIIICKEQTTSFRGFAWELNMGRF